MDIKFVELFVEELAPMLYPRYRYFQQRWWHVTDEDVWLQNGTRMKLMQEIQAIAEFTSLPAGTGAMIRNNIDKIHVMNQVMARLGKALVAWEGLPARREQYPVTDPQP